VKKIPASNFNVRRKEKMQTNTVSTKLFGIISNAINTLMVALGTVSLIWILAYLIVAMVG
jgi:hypothetical protein